MNHLTEIVLVFQQLKGSCRSPTSFLILIPNNPKIVCVILHLQLILVVLGYIQSFIAKEAREKSQKSNKNPESCKVRENAWYQSEVCKCSRVECLICRSQ